MHSCLSSRSMFPWILFLLLAFTTLAAQPPNVIIVVADDQGWGDLSLHGNTNLSTPNIDSLAVNGVQFDRFFVDPVCSPTRAALLTGRYAVRGGVYATSAGGERLDLDEKTLPEYFKAAGYATGAFGKWHNGMQPPYHPNSRGFDEFYGFCSGHWGSYFSPMLENNGKIIQGDGYLPDDLTNQAMNFIAQHQDKPFLAYLPFPTQLPARDAIATGNIERSNRWPNCSYYTNWTNTNDSIYWDVEVLKPGHYQATLYYTCAEENTGAAFRLSANGTAIDFQISEAHNPPLEGARYDRTPRDVSYVKDWKPLKVGSLQLKRGQQRLALSAKDIPGNQAIDFRLLQLDKMETSKSP